MKRFLAPILVLPLLVAGQEPSAQVRRGQELFFNSPKGLPCATCHQLEGKGTPAGPDLKNIAGISPRGIVTAILSSRTMYVVDVETADGKRFPAIQQGESAAGLVFWDLTANQPAKREIPKSRIKAIRDNAKWKHPPESTGYSAAQLADVIAYIRFITKGLKDPVSEPDITMAR
jgi:mono/diheme cytochrome c family protein